MAAVTFDVHFHGVLQTDVRAELIKELVKYILYQRNQIPMYFDQLKDGYKHQTAARHAVSYWVRHSLTGVRLFTDNYINNLPITIPMTT